jgi:predicted permease
MHGFLHDLRSAARALLRAPGFVAVAVATLAVAIAVNAAMFAFLNAAFFRPLPYVATHQLYDLHVEPLSGGAPFDLPRIRDIAEVIAHEATMAAYTERAFVVAPRPSQGREATPEVFQGSEAHGNLFSVVGVKPVIGRDFDARDLIPGAVPTVIVADAFWRSRLDARPDVLGQFVRIDGIDHSIIGVLPRRFAFPDFAQLWVPLADENATLGAASALVRLPLQDTERAVLAIERDLEARGNAAQVRLVSIVPNGGSLLMAMLGAIGFVLLIACSNVANLVLARGTARRHEMGVRIALGASRAVLLRYLCFEGALLAGTAATAGAITSTWLIELLVAAIPADGLPVWFEPRIDATVVLYIALTATIATILSAAVPGIAVTRGALASTLNEAGARSAGDATAARMRAGLVAVQIALATVLLAGAGLLLRALSAQRSVDPGYAADAILEVPTLRPPVAMDEDAFAREAIARVAAIAGVDAAAAAAPALVTGRMLSPATVGVSVNPFTEAVSATWFSTTGLPVLGGRTFEQNEADDGVAVISALVATTLFGSAEAALGARVRFENDEPGRMRTVIGVVGDRSAARPGGLDGATSLAHVYLPLTAGDPSATRVLARIDAGDPIRLAPAIAATLRELDPDAVLRAPRVLGDIERVQAGDLQFFTRIFTAFGTVALALAALGCWGVVAYSVTRRSKEIGLRMALGASARRVVREIAGGMATPLGVGLATGIVGALALGQLLRGILFAVEPMDPLTLAATIVSFAGITGLAAWLPARRAARIDPLRALRAD